MNDWTRGDTVHNLGFKQCDERYLAGFAAALTQGNTRGAGDSRLAAGLSPRERARFSALGRKLLRSKLAADEASEFSELIRRKLRPTMAADQGGNPFPRVGELKPSEPVALDDDPLRAFVRGRLSAADFKKWEELASADPPPFRPRTQASDAKTRERAAAMYARGDLSSSDYAHAVLSPSRTPVGSAERFHREFNTQRLAADGGLDEDVIGQAERRIGHV